MEQKLNKIRQRLIEDKLDALLVTDFFNVGYLSDFWPTEEGDALILITLKSAWLFTDYRYEGMVEKLSISPVLCKKGKISYLKNKISSNVRRIGFERNIRYGDWEKIKKIFSDRELVPVSGLVENLRVIKSGDEIQKIRRAAELADLGFEYIKGIIRPGLTEKFISQKLIAFLRDISPDGEIFFNPIVAGGANGASPHAEPKDEEIKKGDLVILDFGVKFKRYCSDMTRTVLVGGKTPGKRMLKIYDIVLRAQEKSLRAVKPGIASSKLDKIARDCIAKAGYGKYFTHSTGHGVGLEEHEKPSVRADRETAETLKPGMIITIEPGIYVPGLGGVRIEDLVEVTKTGFRVLSKSPKKLITVG